MTDKKMTIAQIEALLELEEECSIEILPNGEVRRLGGGEVRRLGGGDVKGLKLKPITMRENLGGEYAL